MITVLLISYNHEKYIEKAINSVLSQKTTFPISIKIYDDCSTDNTKKIISRIHNTYKDKIDITIREKNIGYVDNIYSAIKEVSTKYFCILECDDYWCDDEKLQLQFDVLEKNSDCSFCGHETLVNNPNKNIRATSHNSKIFHESYKGLLKKKFDKNDDFWIHTSSRLFRSSIIDFNSLNFKESIVNDVCLFWYYLSKGKMFYINKTMSVYNSTGLGLSTSSSPRQSADFLLYSLIKINIDTNFIFHDILFNKIKKHQFFSEEIINNIEKEILSFGFKKAFQDILQNNNNNKPIIPIVTCFDKNYVTPSVIAFYSLLDNADKNYFYKIYVLNSDITLQQQYDSEYCLKKFKNFSIEFINMNNKFEDLWKNLKNKGHFAKEVFYKLLTASIFPQYDKIIATDVDVVFLGDVSSSYNQINPDEDFYLGAVKPLGKILDYYERSTYDKFTHQEADVLKSSCGGYLIMNLKKIRDDKIEQKFIECFEKNLNRLNQAEQDVLNLVCYNKIKFLHLRFLVCSYLYDLYKTPEDFDIDINFSKEEICEAYQNPVQLHYATKEKPWKNPTIAKAEKWYFYLAQTPLFYSFFKTKNTDILYNVDLNKNHILNKDTDSKKVIVFYLTNSIPILKIIYSMKKLKIKLLNITIFRRKRIN